MWCSLAAPSSRRSRGGAEARARGIAGAGLGLAVARDIVEAHGGQIGFTSSEGAGSTFWVALPSAEGAAAGETRAAS